MYTPDFTSGDDPELLITIYQKVVDRFFGTEHADQFTPINEVLTAIESTFSPESVMRLSIDSEEAATRLLGWIEYTDPIPIERTMSHIIESFGTPIEEPHLSTTDIQLLWHTLRLDERMQLDRRLQRIEDIHNALRKRWELFLAEQKGELAETAIEQATIDAANDFDEHDMPKEVDEMMRENANRPPENQLRSQMR